MLILSSYGFEAPYICEKYREYINPSGKTVIILPFAGADAGTAAEYESRYLRRYGYEEQNIFVFDKKKIEDKAKYGYIYVPGGNTFKLLSEIKELKIRDWITKQLLSGADYIGVSAGAYICCRNLKYITNLESNDYIKDDFSGLGIIQENLICHADQYDFSSIAACKRDFDGGDYFLIRNDEVFVVDN